MKKLRVTIDGKVFDVTVEILDDASAPLPQATLPSTAAPTATVTPVPAKPTAAATPPASGGNGPAAPGSVASPLSGKVVSIDVSVGQQVEEGTQVATIEAMKMNTYVYASGAGRVSQVFAKAGEAIEEGAPLLAIAS